MKIAVATALAATTLCWGAMALAHHSFAMFDQSKLLPLKGTVHDFQWTNPHAYIDLDVPDAHGNVVLWKIELNSPNNLERQGWHVHTMRAGDKVTVVINPLRDGQKGGLFVSVRLPDGRVLNDPTREKRGAPINIPH